MKIEMKKIIKKIDPKAGGMFTWDEMVFKIEKMLMQKEKVILNLQENIQTNQDWFKN